MEAKRYVKHKASYNSKLMTLAANRSDKCGFSKASAYLVLYNLSSLARPFANLVSVLSFETSTCLTFETIFFSLLIRKEKPHNISCIIQHLIATVRYCNRDDAMRSEIIRLYHGLKTHNGK